jgi:DNA-binding NarL/FixJ family response regulator
VTVLSPIQLPHGAQALENHEASLCLLVVDDREIVRRGLIDLWRTWPGELRHATARDGRSASLQARAVRPDVALVRDVLTNPDGSSLRNAITSGSPATSVVLLTDRESGDGAYEAESSSPTVSLEVPGDMLMDVVLAHARRSSTEHLNEYVLSLRERLVLDGLASGESNAEIGRRLCLSRGTVKQHAANLYRRLGVHNRAGAVAEAGRRGWLA